MKVSWLIVVGVLASTVSVAFAAQRPSHSSWIHGQWARCHDPDASPRDILKFAPQESAEVIRQDGSTTPLVYKIVGDTVKMGVFNLGVMRPFELKVSVDNGQRFFTSDRTGNTATYVRVGTETKYSCSI